MNFYVNEILIGNGSLQKQGTNDTGQWMSVTSFAYNTKLIDLDSLNYMRNQDYNKGYRAAANARLENLTPWGQITLGVDELFNIPLFGNVTIGSVMRIGLGAVMVGIIMKLFLGG